MPIFPFGELLVDQPALNNTGVVAATNVYPAATGYIPVPSLQPNTGPLDTRPRSAIRVRGNDGISYSFAGNTQKIFQLSDQDWNDISRPGGYNTAADERWEFAQFGNKLLATNFSNSPQQFTLGASSTFTDLTTAFRARTITALRNFALAGNTFDATDGEVRNRIRWSAFNDDTNWTPDPSTLSDFTDLLTGGEVHRVVGGEFGLIFQERSIRRMTFVGAPTVFQIDEVLPGVGLLAPGGLVQDGRTVYFLSQRGFFSLTDGTGLRPIGAEKIDRFVLDELDSDFLPRVSAAVDPVSGRVFWAYPGAGNLGGVPNRIVVYDTNLDKWSIIEQQVHLVWRSGGNSINLDTDDPAVAGDPILDDVDISFDSARYKGQGQGIGAFNTQLRSGLFDGDPMTARIETAEQDTSDGRRTFLTAFRPMVEGGLVTAQIGTRNDLVNGVAFGPELERTGSGRFTARANARYHRIRFNISGGWKHAIGVQVDSRDAKPRGRR